MAGDGEKVRMSVWVGRQDRENAATIARVYGLASDSAALRYALQRVAREARAEEARTTRPGGEPTSAD